ncbi:hypothetical protein C8Q80DRAFT_1105420 [Daedaleopsis nitida]|nr:hypothetical protein C8Q80DRAFT_1105420 [Daedaleopsis nitida]
MSSLRVDACTTTPWLYDGESQTLVTYDDGSSFKTKGQFVGTYGVGGFEMFEIAHDYNNLLVDEESRPGRRIRTTVD